MARLSAQAKAEIAGQPDYPEADRLLAVLLAGDPETETFTDEEYRFLRAFWEEQGTLHRVAIQAGLPYRRMKALMEEPRMAWYVDQLTQSHLGEVHHLFIKRAGDPQNKMPAFPIFALKSRDIRYSERPMTPVAVQVNVTDGGRGGAVVELGSVPGVTIPKQLTA